MEWKQVEPLLLCRHDPGALLELCCCWCCCCLVYRRCDSKLETGPAKVVRLDRFLSTSPHLNLKMHLLPDKMCIHVRVVAAVDIDIATFLSQTNTRAKQLYRPKLWTFPLRSYCHFKEKQRVSLIRAERRSEVGCLSY